MAHSEPSLDVCHRRVYKVVDEPPGHGAACLVWGGIDGQLRTGGSPPSQPIPPVHSLFIAGTGPEGGGSCEMSGAVVSAKAPVGLPRGIATALCLLIQAPEAVFQIALEREVWPTPLSPPGRAVSHGAPARG